MSDAITRASAGISFTLLDPCLTLAPSCGELAAFRLRFTGSYISARYGPAAVISVTEVNLARVPRALEGEVKGGSSLEGAGKGRLWRKGSHKGVDRGAQCALIPSFLPVNVLVSLIAVNQMDPYDSDRSDGGPGFPSQSTNPQPPPPPFQRSGTVIMRGS